MKLFKIQVNPYLEFMNSILLTSRYNEITSPMIGYGLMADESNPYTEVIKAFFRPYKDHPIYSYVEEMIPSGFTFSRPVELALSLGESKEFVRHWMPNELCVNYCGGFERMEELIRRMREMEEEIHYFDFFKEVKGYYDPYIKQAREVVQAYPYITLLEEEYGKEQSSYHYVLQALMRGNYGICFTDPTTGKVDMFSVFATDDYCISSAILFHEYSHPFINPLTERYMELANQYEYAYELLKPYKLPAFQSGYGDWQECINEHLVRAMVIHLLRKCKLYSMADDFLNRDLYRGYKYIPNILKKYEYYDAHRETYANFEQFYPELLKVFATKFEL